MPTSGAPSSGAASTCWSRSRWRRASGEADRLLAAAGGRVLGVGHVSTSTRRCRPSSASASRPASSRCSGSGSSPRSLDVDVVLDLMIHDLRSCTPSTPPLAGDPGDRHPRPFRPHRHRQRPGRGWSRGAWPTSPPPGSRPSGCGVSGSSARAATSPRLPGAGDPGATGWRRSTGAQDPARRPAGREGRAPAAGAGGVLAACRGQAAALVTGAAAAGTGDGAGRRRGDPLDSAGPQASGNDGPSPLFGGVFR